MIPLLRLGPACGLLDFLPPEAVQSAVVFTGDH